MEEIDGSLINIGKYILSAFVGGLITRFFEKKSKLISYLGPTIRCQLIHEDKKTVIHTHFLIIRNTGQKAAENVKIGHRTLPKPIKELVNIHPSSIGYSISDTTQNIEIPILVPGEQITISYVYPPSITDSRQINTEIKSNDGISKKMPAVLTNPYTGYRFAILCLLAILGCMTIIYLIFRHCHSIKVLLQLF